MCMKNETDVHWIADTGGDSVDGGRTGARRERPAKVIEAYGFNRTTMYKWIKAAFRPGVGIKALRSTKATGRPRSLTPRQERQVFRWVNGRDPRQYGLDFGLWTRAVVAELIEKKFGVQLGLTAVGELLAKLGLTPQKPLQRAYQRDPQAIEKWQRETYPAIARKRRQTVLRYSSGTSPGFAPTPYTARPGAYVARPRWFSAGAAPIGQCGFGGEGQGAFWFCTYEGALNGELFVELAQEDDEVPRESRSIWCWTACRRTRGRSSVSTWHRPKGG